MIRSPGFLNDRQARDTFFIVPDILNIYSLALGDEGYRQFRNSRELARTSGGELLLIGWPDGTTVTLHRLDASRPIDVDNLVDLYRASAAMRRVMKAK